MKVGVLHWAAGSELSSTFAAGIEAEGHQVIDFLWNERVPDHADFIFVHGPFGTLVPMANQMLALPSRQRPGLVLWMSEQFWDPRLPTRVGRPLSRLRSALERWAHAPTPDGHWRVRAGWRPLLGKACRFRYFGDILWLRRSGLLSLLVVPSDWTNGFLRRRGIEAFTAYSGYTPTLGTDLGLERDIPVLWLGKPGSRRRRFLVKNIRRRLAQRGIEMTVVDGREHPYVFGAERTRLLNRTRVVLNLMRKPWDSNYMRYLLAMANGALIVTEPTYPHAPFEAGKHVVVAPLDEIVNSIAHYATHATAREAIAARAHSFITSQLTLQRSISRVLARVERVREGAP